jgi:trans-AT polyketide synthase/acyltransferase/oxidoreductase domain-containing protein
MEKRVVFLFSGQGSQYAGMGKELFEQNPIFRRWMLHLDDITKTCYGESVLYQLYEKERHRGEVFDRLLYTHPAIFMVEYALAQTLIEQGVCPDLVVGSSLGAFVAAALAGILRVEDALSLVMKQALLFEAHCQPGRMLAILHNVSLYYQVPELTAKSELVAVNCLSHFVVAGTIENIQQIKDLLTTKGVICEILAVSYAFHSSLIDSVKPYFKNALAEISYQRPQISYFSALSCTERTIVPDEYFWDVVRKPIFFSRVIQALENSGYEQYIDAGLGGTLANFARRTFSATSQARCYTILSPFHQDVRNLASMLGIFASSRGENGKES